MKNRKNNYKYLINNIGILAISKFGVKLLSFILIPIYTLVLTTDEYGVFDIYSTTISLLIPFLTINISNAVLRFLLDEKHKKADVFSIGVRRVLLSFFILILLTLLNCIFNIIPILNKYWYYFIIIYIFEVLYNLLINFARGIDKIKITAISGVISSVVLLISNIVMLLIVKKGLSGFFISNILSYVLPTLFLFIKLKVWNYININNKNTILRKEMEKYSKPMIFNTVGWWITNASDRYIVSLICGISVNGIYSISYKIPSVLNIFQDIFNQAWVLSAVKEYENGNQEELYSTIYIAYNLLLVFICSLLIVFDKIIAHLLFSNNFYEAWKFAPFLMISVVFGALSGLLEGVFIANKNTRAIAKTTVIGAVTNIILNLILVTIFGAIGAAIATLISYIIVWLLRLIDANKIVKIKVNNNKCILSYVILIIQSILLFLNNWCVYIIEFLLVLLLIQLYWSEIKKYYKLFIKKLLH